MIALPCVPAYASDEQTSVTAPAEEDAKRSRNDEIIVTGALAKDLRIASDAGSRLDLTPLETPATVSVLTGAQVRLRGDATINGAVTRAVGITSTATVGGGGNGVAARGFAGSSVAYIYDGIRNMAGLGNLAFPYDPWTVERIEVLNGPGSVLYGTGAIGGAVNVVPRRPSEHRETTVRVSGGSFGTFREAIDTTGPIGDRLLYRFDVSQQNSLGYIHNGDSKSTAISGALTFIATDTLKITLSDDYGFIRPMNYNGLPLVNGVALRSLRKVNYGSSDVDVHFKENTARIETRWEPSDAFTLRNISSLVTAARVWKQGPTQLNYQPATNDIVRGSYGLYEQRQQQWNNQLELTWSQTLGNRLSVGGDIEHLNFKRIVSTWSGTSVVSLTNPTPGVYPTTTPARSGGEAIVDRFSLFIDDHLQLTPRLAVLGGLRFDNNKISRHDAFNGNVTARTYRPLSGRIGAVYNITPSFTAYVQYSYASDPISNVCCISAQQLGYDVANGQQIEFGLKQSLFEDRVSWTLSAYRIRKNNLLVPDPRTPSALIQVGAQSSRGIEATLVVGLIKGLQVEANGTVLEAKYDDFDELVSGALISRDGNRPTNVPVESANLWLNWDVAKRIKAQAGLRYVGDRFIDTGNSQRTPSYTVVDANIRWAATDWLAIDARAFNLFDRLYPTTFIGNGRGGGSWQLGTPQSFEISVTAQF
jgi:iron complex outermembrane receptor protein